MPTLRDGNDIEKPAILLQISLRRRASTEKGFAPACQAEIISAILISEPVCSDIPTWGVLASFLSAYAGLAIRFAVVQL